MKSLKILGTGCPKCDKLAALTREAAEAAGIEFELEKVTDIQQIMQHGVAMTPALVVDGEVKLIGKVPSVDELKDIITA